MNLNVTFQYHVSQNLSAPITINNNYLFVIKKLTPTMVNYVFNFTLSTYFHLITSNIP